ncbi:hypothetical protein BGX28_007564 [Mortierella sp. GBA30]|nr:hypothetical protein BGX28_007564 [Mortierella sp. GBA30]
MSTSRIANSIKSAIGGAKKSVGAALGNETMQASGKVQKAGADAANLAARAKEQAKGLAHDIKGATQKAVGSATGNKTMEAEGHVNTALGKVERTVGTEYNKNLRSK